MKMGKILKFTFLGLAPAVASSALFLFGLNEYGYEKINPIMVAIGVLWICSIVWADVLWPFQKKKKTPFKVYSEGISTDLLPIRAGVGKYGINIIFKRRIMNKHFTPRDKNGNKISFKIIDNIIHIPRFDLEKFTIEIDQEIIRFEKIYEETKLI